MSYLIKNGNTTRPLLFLMTDATDHLTGKTGLVATLTVTISKNGAAFAAPAGAVTEIGHGWYKVAPNAVDANTLGPLVLNATATGADPDDERYEVVSFDPDDVFWPNLALAYNGTGYVAPTAPAQQQQVANIAVTGAALNATAVSRTLTTGTETNAYTDTVTADGVTHTITSVAGTIDLYYQFSLGSTGQTAVGAQWLGYVSGLTNSLKVYAWNWGTTAWDQLGSIAGTSGTTPGIEEFELTSAHTGTGGNIGLVRLRFQNTGLTTATLNTDRLLCGYAVVPTFPANFAALGIAVSGNLLTVESVVNGVTVTTNNDKQGYDLNQSFPGNFATLGISPTGHIVNVDTLSIYTNNVPQSGDAYARLGAPAGVSVSADLATVNGRLTAARAGYLDNLNVGGPVASHADFLAINQSASKRLLLTTVQLFERPEAGTTLYTLEARTFSPNGAAVAADLTPVLTATGQTSGDLTANLSIATNPATGVYRWTYTVASNATTEPLRFDLSAVLGGATWTLAAYSQILDEVSTTFTTTDKGNLTAIFNKLPSTAYLTGTTSAAGAVDMAAALGNFPGTVGGVVGGTGGGGTVDLTAMANAVWTNTTRTLTGFSFPILGSVQPILTAGTVTGRRADMAVARGSDVSIMFRLVDSNNQPVTDDLSGWDWMLWLANTSSDNAPLYGLLSTAPGQGVDNTAKTITVNVPASATEGFDPEGTYYYEFRKTNAGANARIVYGAFYALGGPGNPALVV